MKILRIVLIVLVAGLLSLNYFFPLAESLGEMESQKIDAVYFYEKEDDMSKLTVDITQFVDAYNSAKSTRKLSLHDRPTSDYYTAEISYDNGSTHKVYFFKEVNKWYIEIPYTGIYKVKDMKLQL